MLDLGDGHEWSLPTFGEKVERRVRCCCVFCFKFISFWHSIIIHALRSQSHFPDAPSPLAHPSPSLSAYFLPPVAPTALPTSADDHCHFEAMFSLICPFPSSFDKLSLSRLNNFNKLCIIHIILFFPTPTPLFTSPLCSSSFFDGIGIVWTTRL